MMLFTFFVLVGFGVAAPTAIQPAGESPSPARERRTLSFQQGVDGFKGTVDTELWAVSPNRVMEKEETMTTDADNDGGESQILIRFEGIIGTGPNQVLPNSTIHSARLFVTAFDPGNTVDMHRMLVPWDRCATWNTMNSGVTADGLEASRHKDSFTFGTITNNKSLVAFEATDTVQAWVNGAANYGWVFINNGANGWDFYASEFEETVSRPKLLIEFSPPSSSSTSVSSAQPK